MRLLFNQLSRDGPTRQSLPRRGARDGNPAEISPLNTAGVSNVDTPAGHPRSLNDVVTASKHPRELR